MRRPLLLATLLTGFFFPLVQGQESRATLTDYERNIVAAVLVLEASSEGRDGMAAVLNVIYNRAGRQMDRVIPETVRRNQFCSLRGVAGARNPDYGPILARAYRQPESFRTAMSLVQELELDMLRDNTFGATHFHTVSIPPPYWVRDMRYLLTIGRHRFYSERRNNDLQANNN